MKFSAEIDHELTFADETHNPCRIRDAILINGHVCDDPQDAVTAYAHSVRIGKDYIGPEFGNCGGKKATAYSKTVKTQLHHEREYCPCRRLSPDEYEDCKCHDI